MSNEDISSCVARADFLLKQFLIEMMGEEQTFKYLLERPNPPIIYVNYKIKGTNALGAFVTPSKSNQLVYKEGDILESHDGVILISLPSIIKCFNDSENKDEWKVELIKTIIHERLHSLRMYKFNLPSHPSNSGFTYFIDEGRIEQATSNMEEGYFDFNQDILKGDIDSSIDTIKKYENKTFDELEDLNDFNGIGSLLEYQINVDETLVELMTNIAFKLGKNISINDTIKQLACLDIDDYLDDQDDTLLITMAKIIDKHGDNTLIKWMLNPINPLYYSGNPHDDFFGKYTADDKELTKYFHGEFWDNLGDSFNSIFDNLIDDEPFGLG